MLQVPEWFAEELESQSFGRYRVRWSAGRQRFQVEERIGRQRRKRARLFEQESEEARREQDGYRLLFEITPGSRTRCPRCAQWIKVREMSVGTTKCGMCKKEWKFFFMPLGWRLLEHLRYIQPERGAYDRVDKDTDRGMAEKDARDRRDRHNTTEAIWKEDFTKNFEIDSVGWTPRGARIGARTWS